MKANIGITLFDVQNLDIMMEFTKIISYEECSVGLHINAKREHYHIHMFNCDLPEIKDLSKYYRRRLPSGILKNDVKFTFYLEDDVDFCRMKCLGYPLKEYDSIDEIPENVRQYITLNPDDLESCWRYSHTIYLSAKYKVDREKQRKELTKTTLDKLYVYLDKRMWDEMIDADDDCLLHEYKHPKDGFLKICEYIVDFNLKVQGKKSFRWNDVPNQALTFMTRKAKEHNIWNLHNIIIFGISTIS